MSALPELQPTDDVILKSKFDPADAAVKVGIEAIKAIMNSIDTKMKIGCTIVNNSQFRLEKLDGSGSLHHGKTYQALSHFIDPLNIEEANEGVFKNHSEWALQTAGAHCSEGIIVYQCKEISSYFCFYLKHGKHFEAGCFILDQDTWNDTMRSFEKDLKHNSHWQYPQKDRTGEKVIHYLQKFSPKGSRNKAFTKYCTKDTSATVKYRVDGNRDLFVHFQAAESVEFNITQEGFTE